MNYIEPLFQIDVKSLILWIFVILIAFQFSVKLCQWFIDFLGIETKAMRHKREEHELLMTTSEQLKKLSEQHSNDMKQMYDDNYKHYQQSCDIRENLSNRIIEMSEKLDEMKQTTDMRFEKNEKRENKRVQAELKDRISESYRYYHPRKQINIMEIEALEDLIKAYESYGGENSFVHSVVQKEMYTWELIENK